MANQDIRKEAKDAGLKLWQIAEVYGLNDSNFSRLLRRQLKPELKVRIFKIIEQLKEEN